MLASPALAQQAQPFNDIPAKFQPPEQPGDFIKREVRRHGLVRMGTDLMAIFFCPAWMIVSRV